MYSLFTKMTSFVTQSVAAEAQCSAVEDLLCARHMRLCQRQVCLHGALRTRRTLSSGDDPCVVGCLCCVAHGSAHQQEEGAAEGPHVVADKSKLNKRVTRFGTVQRQRGVL